MAIDFEKLKRKLEGGEGLKGWVKFKKGEHVVRIAPVADGDPFKTFFLHYGVGGSTGFPCPKKNFDEPCPVCEFASQLWREGTDESRNMAKELFVRERHYSPVLVRGQEDQGIRWWSYGKEIYELLINLCLNPEYGDLTDVESGTDLTLSISQPEGQKFPKTVCTPKRSSSKFLKDKAKVDETLATMPDLAALIGRKTTEEVQAILACHFLAEEKKESEGKEDREKYGSGDKGSEEKTPEEPTNVEAALDELLKDSEEK